MNPFAGEHHEFLGQNLKGYLIKKNFNPMVPSLVITKQISRHIQPNKPTKFKTFPGKMVHIFYSRSSEAETPSKIELISRRKSKKRK